MGQTCQLVIIYIKKYIFILQFFFIIGNTAAVIPVKKNVSKHFSTTMAGKVFKSTKTLNNNN